MKKILMIVGALLLVAGLTVGLSATVFAQDNELVGELANNCKPYRGYAGKIMSLEDSIVTLERGGGWTVQITLADETKYYIIREEATAEEFAAYVTEYLGAGETVRAVARANRQDDGTIIADAIRIIPMLVAGEVTSVTESEIILETGDGQLALALTADTRYGIPGQGQVTAEQFMAYFNEANENGNVVKVVVRANKDNGTVTALGIRVIRANDAQKRMMQAMQRLRNRHLNRIMNCSGQGE